MTTFQELISAAIAAGASDLHLCADMPPCARINGRIVRIGDTALSSDAVGEIVKSVMDEKLLAVLDQAGEVDFARSEPSLGRFRINAFRQRGSLSMAARILNSKIPSPPELGIPEAVVAMTDKKRGLVLVTGSTGSGKSTTLASLIDVINGKYNHHILTLEDPIEYIHTPKNSIINQREMGSDSANYSTALRAALRQDPDVILVGEMRDLETISIAVTAAETGHLVFSTLHTLGAANTVDRIIDVFPPHQQQQIRTQLADVLQCVISQQLIPRMDGKGRVAAMEVMLTTTAIKNHIREAKTFQIPTVIQTSGRLGMITMDDAIFELYSRGVISAENAVSYSQDKAAIAKRLS